MSRWTDWIPGAARLRERLRERGSWVLCEEVRAGIREMDVLVAARRSDGKVSGQDAELLRGADEALAEASRVIAFDGHRRCHTASHVTSAQLHLNSGRSLWMRTLSPRDLQCYLPAMIATVKQYLVPTDENRAVVEQIAVRVRKAQATGRPARLSGDQLVTLVSSVSAARQAALREKLRANSFVRIVHWVTIFLFLLVVLIGVLTAWRDSAVPLCFFPVSAPGSKGEVSVVCPVGSRMGVPAADVAAATRETAGWADYVVVEIVGIVAAGIAAASALRKIRGTSTAFGIPVALAMLKLPTGALTAVLGLLLMRGAFVPGLNALDSSAQIIAWAVVLGYSQQLFTRWVDRQGQAVLDSVREPVPATLSPPRPAPAAPASATGRAPPP
ncbi:hypothetical protein [Actinomadura chibensis]|uniref:Uncharacterized protein n=1 Tax=Actinomadura chibensis TaxID=392828 RepID=A0A5D0NIE0_9ACTN|nr:hypothetical protein [Actinomadura chibensis]TYB44190.1 hypothetical protein FXF69_24890 [Actinomadura chibensis]